MLPTKFQFIWPNGFRGEDFLEIDQSETRIACGGRLLTNWDDMRNFFQRTFHRYFLPSFGSFGHAVSEDKIFQKLTNQKQELPVVAMFVNGSGRNVQSLQRTFRRCFLPSFGSFGRAVSEEKIFLKSTNQKQELPVAAMFVNGSGRNVQSIQRTFHRCFLPNKH